MLYKIVYLLNHIGWKFVLVVEELYNYLYCRPLSPLDVTGDTAILCHRGHRAELTHDTEPANRTDDHRVVYIASFHLSGCPAHGAHLTGRLEKRVISVPHILVWRFV